MTARAARSPTPCDAVRDDLPRLVFPTGGVRVLA